MSKSKIEETIPTPEAPKRTKVYTFPDIAGGKRAVTVEAASLEEATEKYLKGQAPA